MPLKPKQADYGLDGRNTVHPRREKRGTRNLHLTHRFEKEIHRCHVPTANARRDEAATITRERLPAIASIAKKYPQA